MQGKVEIAGVNTAKLKVLKNEETMALLRRTKEGDQEARHQPEVSLDRKSTRLNSSHQF